ncbi:MAG: hypothetical protein ACJAUL_003687 [Paraglaciecola sp.]|jgi:hypothetical protein
MLNKTTISAVLLTLSLANTAHGEEVSLERYIGNMLAQSVVGVQQELNNNIQGAVLTAANQFSLFEQETYATKTSITDLTAKVENAAKHEAE